MATTTEFDPYEGVVGQSEARRFLAASAADPVHAYLLVGPEGAGTRDLALGFAADLLCRDHPDGDWENIRHRVVGGNHPDVFVVEGDGVKIRESESQRILDEASMSTVEGPRKVIIGIGFDGITEAARAQLLKTVEEPPQSVVFVFTAESVPEDLVTIASRCVRVDVPALSVAEVRTVLDADPLLAAKGSAQLDQAAEASGGDLRTARILASDDRFALRLEAWASSPERLDGTGTAVFEVVAGLVSMSQESTAAMEAVLKAEAEAAEAEAEVYGRRKESRTDEAARHRRILRKLRVTDMRAGLGVLARRYRDAALEGSLPAGEASDAVARIDGLTRDLLVRNPNETLQLQALFLQLPALPSAR